ncbi:MAG: hypothetical protein GEU98_16950 [Pseudonocardiaceae bacterium]|nr:hypothetical protein [Pseudonocardiaceae bacterium]
MSESLVRVLLLRHGEVASHRGDVPVTEHGWEVSSRAGKALGAHPEPITVLYGGTRRTRETAEAIVAGIDDPVRASGPIDAFALRNPDIYVSGVRVNMVSSVAALAEQVPGLSEEDAAANPFFAEFIPRRDRIGWWLSHPDPPGESAGTIADRMDAFVRSVGDPGPLHGRLVVGVTHSPVVRSVLSRGTGRDPGEPAYLSGAEILLHPDGTLTAGPYEPRDD